MCNVVLHVDLMLALEKMLREYKSQNFMETHPVVAEIFQSGPIDKAIVLACQNEATNKQKHVSLNNMCLIVSVH